MVIIGNPPYNVGQKNENDNNKNRRYPIIDWRVSQNLCKRLPGKQQKCSLRCLREVLSLGS